VLDDFIVSNRQTIIAGAWARVASRGSPRPTEIEQKTGVAAFLDQLGDAIRLARSDEGLDREQRATDAGRHGNDFFQMGLTVGQLVHGYGDVGHVITELALQQRLPISEDDSRVLSRCLDDAVADAVSEWVRQREMAINSQGTERLGLLAHELRNLLNTGMLAYERLKQGQVAIGGSTGQVLGRSLVDLRDLVDRSLSEVRADAGISRFGHIVVADFLAEIEAGAAMQAAARGLQFKASSVDHLVAIEGDRQLLAAAVSNLLHNAFKFTRKGGTVSLATTVTALRVLFEVEDECSGLPPGKIEELFVPYSQRGRDRTGIGLGLPLCLKAAKANGGEISVRDLPGKGCIFILNLPKKHRPPSSPAGGEVPGSSPTATPLRSARAQTEGARTVTSLD
jgi:signal transduction histidine kinase